jgi:hypothetical protein
LHPERPVITYGTTGSELKQCVELSFGFQTKGGISYEIAFAKHLIYVLKIATQTYGLSCRFLPDDKASTPIFDYIVVL